MRVPRFYTVQALALDQTVILEEPVSHHLLRVLRLQPGDPLQLFNGDGKEYQAILEGGPHKQAKALITGMQQPERESNLRLMLGQGISRGERMDFVLQKSVELGVHSVTPLWTNRSQVQLSGKRLEKRLSHWRGVIKSACEQSGRVILPQLNNAVNLQDWHCLEQPQRLQLVLDPTASLHLTDIRPATVIQVLIGPEGGLDDEEIRKAEEHGFQRIRLGPRILRTETAALATLTAVQTLWGDLSA